MPRKRGVKKNSSDFKPALDGAEICYEEYEHPVLHELYRNFTLRCPRRGPGCTKTRGRYARAFRQYGDVGPLAELHAWIQLDDPSKNRSRVDPKKEHTVAYLRDRKDELEALLPTLVPHP